MQVQRLDIETKIITVRLIFLGQLDNTDTDSANVVNIGMKSYTVILEYNISTNIRHLEISDDIV